MKKHLLIIWGVCVFVLLIIWTTNITKSCSKDTENIATALPKDILQKIKYENEIQGLQRQIEGLQKQDSVFRNQINATDSSRLQNFVDSRNKSLLDNYSELSKRYTKQKTVR